MLYCAKKIVARDILDTIFQFSAHHSVRSHLTDVTNIRKGQTQSSHLISTLPTLKRLLVVESEICDSIMVCNCCLMERCDWQRTHLAIKMKCVDLAEWA